MLTRFLAAFAACFTLSLPYADAGFVVEGFSYTRLAPPLPGGNFGVLSQAINPVNGEVWTSDGQTLHRVGPNNDWDLAQSILLKDGGPVRNNNVTGGIAFDSQGRLYINDFGTGEIFRRENDSAPWEHFATSYQFPRVMHFGQSDILYILGANATPSDVGILWTIQQDGLITDLGVTQGESFAFGPDNTILIPVWEGGGIDRLGEGGNVLPVFHYDDRDGEWESIALTAGGNYIIGVNTFFDEALDRNTSKIIRVDGVTGERELLAIDLDLSVPVEMWIDGGALVITGYGSLHAYTVTGDFDGPLVPLAQTPEPSTFALVAVGAVGLFAWRRKRKCRSDQSLPSRS